MEENQDKKVKKYVQGLQLVKTQAYRDDRGKVIPGGSRHEVIQEDRTITISVNGIRQPVTLNNYNELEPAIAACLEKNRWYVLSDKAPKGDRG